MEGAPSTSDAPTDIASAAQALMQPRCLTTCEAAPSAKDEADAVLALSFLRVPAPAAPPASKLAQLAGATSVWPFLEGKGCFIKSRDGKDLPFLERLYLLLSLPNLLLPSHPGRRIGEAICWKPAEAQTAMNLPPNVSAFEIGDVALLEAAIYPQYASGSFNKTASKWGIISPASHNPAVASKRLTRECMYLPPAEPLGRSVLRPLRAEATYDEIMAHVALWDKVKKRRISANDYKGDLDSYLRANPHLEVYNRQDVELSRKGNQVVAGTKLALERTGAGEPKVVLWDTKAQAKVPVGQCPTQNGLCAYLRANAHVEVYYGQTAAPLPRALPDILVVDLKADLKSGAAATDGAKKPDVTCAAPLKPPVADVSKLTTPAASVAAKPAVLSLSNAKPLLPRGLQEVAAVTARQATASESPATIYKMDSVETVYEGSTLRGGTANCPTPASRLSHAVLTTAVTPGPG